MSDQAMRDPDDLYDKNGALNIKAEDLNQRGLAKLNEARRRGNLEPLSLSPQQAAERRVVEAAHTFIVLQADGHQKPWEIQKPLWDAVHDLRRLRSDAQNTEAGKGRADQQGATADATATSTGSVRDGSGEPASTIDWKPEDLAEFEKRVWVDLNPEGGSIPPSVASTERGREHWPWPEDDVRIKRPIGDVGIAGRQPDRRTPTIEKRLRALEIESAHRKADAAVDSVQARRIQHLEHKIQSQRAELNRKDAQIKLWRERAIGRSEPIMYFGSTKEPYIMHGDRSQTGEASACGAEQTGSSPVGHTATEWSEEQRRAAWSIYSAVCGTLAGPHVPKVLGETAAQDVCAEIAKHAHLFMGQPERLRGYCDHCGWRGSWYRLEEKDASDAEGKAHDRTCPSHPMRALEREVSELCENLRRAEKARDEARSELATLRSKPSGASPDREALAKVLCEKASPGLWKGLTPGRVGHTYWLELADAALSHLGATASASQRVSTSDAESHNERLTR